MKKRGFGVGKWNGYGGKFEGNESTRASATRELQEESGLEVKEEDLSHVAVINFYFDNAHMFECHVFSACSWKGEPAETEEMRPQWYLQSQLPYSEMWVDDQYWIPMVLAGKKIKADFYFNKDGNVIQKHSIQEVESL